jgi:DNA repair photolyase
MEGMDEYTANFYRGCTHGCVYCYAPSLIHDERTWGRYVDVKVNAAEVIGRELRRAKKRVVFLSSASDPYQPVEAKYGLTRRALLALLRNEFPAAILTRSPLVLRDLDILRKLPWVRVGISISSIPERRYEPGVVPLDRRIHTLRKLSEAGIRTWVSLAPLVPGMMRIDLVDVFRKLREAGVSSVGAGILRFQGYERSKELFEQTAGVLSNELVAGANETMSSVKKLIDELGFESTHDLFDWRSTRREFQEYGRLDDEAMSTIN